EQKMAVITITPEGYDEAVIDKTIAGVTDGIKTIKLFAGSNEIDVNSEKRMMDTPIELINGRTMVPLRVVSESLDCSVEWNEATFTVSVNKPDMEIPAECIQDRPYTDEDLLWLSRIIHVEGKGLSINGRLAIANVVVNRKNSPRFPNTIQDVIFAPGQFPPAHKKGFEELVPTRGCIIAAKMALEGINNIEDCMFFNHKPFNSSNIKLFKRIDGEYFYKYK
ncbi:MAG: copper amine oxidase, partial [Clostridiaceae bacterium]|nr:copper amine oxidase [Clostridiaceae bacterium]